MKVNGYNGKLHVYSVFTAACTFFLIIAGGLVTSTGSGLAVPDWPLSYGKLMPPMIGGIFYEHGHRMVATFVGLLTVILAVWLAQSEERRWVRMLGFVALATVIAQGLLGGLTVMFLLPTAISVSHATLAQTFFGMVSAIALFTSRWWREVQPHAMQESTSSSLVRLSVVTTAAIYIQLILGALMRHTSSGLAVPDFPLAYGQVLPSLSSESLAAYNQQLIYSDIRLAADGPIVAGQIVVHLLHRFWAVIVTFLIGWTAIRLKKEWKESNRLSSFAHLLGGLALVQITLGVFTVLSRRAIDITTAHVAIGALLLVVSLLATLHVIRLTGLKLRFVSMPYATKEGIA